MLSPVSRILLRTGKFAVFWDAKSLRSRNGYAFLYQPSLVLVRCDYHLESTLLPTLRIGLFLGSNTYLGQS